MTEVTRLQEFREGETCVACGKLVPAGKVHFPYPDAQCVEKDIQG